MAKNETTLFDTHVSNLLQCVEGHDPRHFAKTEIRYADLLNLGQFLMSVALKKVRQGRVVISPATTAP
jgi:hypothetical protein